jgi:hypothetical protein
LRDIPEVTTRVVERRLHKRRCGCDVVTVAAAPAGVSAPVAYGPNLRAVAVYLLVYQHIPVARAAELIADVTGARCSTGWISKRRPKPECLLWKNEAVKPGSVQMYGQGNVERTQRGSAPQRYNAGKKGIRYLEQEIRTFQGQMNKLAGEVASDGADSHPDCNTQAGSAGAARPCRRA